MIQVKYRFQRQECLNMENTGQEGRQKSCMEKPMTKGQIMMEEFLTRQKLYDKFSRPILRLEQQMSNHEKIQTSKLSIAVHEARKRYKQYSEIKKQTQQNIIDKKKFTKVIEGMRKQKPQCLLNLNVQPQKSEERKFLIFSICLFILFYEFLWSSCLKFIQFLLEGQRAMRLYIFTHKLLQENIVIITQKHNQQMLQFTYRMIKFFTQVHYLFLKYIFFLRQKCLIFKRNTLALLIQLVYQTLKWRVRNIQHQALKKDERKFYLQKIMWQLFRKLFLISLETICLLYYGKSNDGTSSQHINYKRHNSILSFLMHLASCKKNIKRIFVIR